ncbi:translation initiation factor IF-2 subunit beta [Halobaculum sp. CBA1158]|uniref:translation initiation factor IF-2 subunit beta n=1 Tax=Halobaculum sp. CBA1158 TaxID=2904243 RepID=UPI001F160F9C|nr:translation initiation factor IF-2 subunit beta [Halobaculum sp. CBA1158]UIO98682.1 translation initiation factor IF-2 subunit beta [Halobaculum sp. CBA1158]
MDYDDMLDRAVEETPDIDEHGSRFEVPDPEVRPEGNVTVIENFQTLVDRLNREESELLKYLQDELGTAARIDESGRARLTGEFKQRRVADAVESYTDGYVICSECGLPDTRIVEQGGADVLKCDACGAITSLGE